VGRILQLEQDEVQGHELAERVFATPVSPLTSTLKRLIGSRNWEVLFTFEAMKVLIIVSK
jgi:hypothetical protein